MAGPDELISSPGGQGANSLSPEQRDTAKLLKTLMGKTVADRYVDFCRLSAGDFDLKVASPMAAHALRELDSILRSTLAVPFDAKTDAALSDTQRKEAVEALKALGHDQAAIDRAVGALAPRENHREQISKIVTRLGLDAGGDIAKNWFRVMRAAYKAHEREFNRDLSVDDEFRREWSKPFDTVVRGVAVALQGHYSALAKRVEFLASLDDTEKAVTLFESEIPGAQSLQRHFYTQIQGARWLPVLIKHDLMEPPRAVDEEDDGNGVRIREWPVGAYLLSIAKSGNQSDCTLVAEAIRSVKASDHADLRRDGLEIMAALPGDVAASLADVAEEWLQDNNSLLFGGHHAEALLKKLASAGDHQATFRIAKAMLRLFETGGKARSLYSHHMYEHNLPKTAKRMVDAVGIEALRYLVSLLYEAGVLDDKIRVDPPADYTSVILAPLNRDPVYDIFGALVRAVHSTAVELIKKQDAPAAEIVGILTEHKQRIFRRIAYATLAHNPQGAPDLADEMLMDLDALGSSSLRYEYGELAAARFPFMTAEKQAALLQLIETMPTLGEVAWRKRYEEHYKKSPDAEDVRVYQIHVIRDAVWEWRDVLPDNWKTRIEAIVAEIHDPDAWMRDMQAGDKSPMSAEDFKTRSPAEVAEYLRTWQPDTQNKETKTALAFELYKAVQADAPKFADGAMAFFGLAPVYVRRFFEGLRHPAQNKSSFNWTEPLKLIESILPVMPPAPGETSSGGDDPSWFWAALEGGQLLKAGLQQGKEGIGGENAERVFRLVRAFDTAAPPEPEGENFESSYKEHTPFFAAEGTMLGLATELHILELFWLSKQEESFVAKAPKAALVNSPDFADFAGRSFALGGANGRIVRAIFGRFLDWLFYFGADWLKANMGQIFPADREQSDAAWVSHLVNGGGPILALTLFMTDVYAGENEHLLVPRATNEREWRQDRYGEYVLLNYLHGDFPKQLLDGFLTNAPPRLLQHTIWYLGRELRRKDYPEDALKRGKAYWEMRLAAGEKSNNKEAYQTELGSFGGWLHDTDLEPAWIIEQMRRMLRAGYAPSQSYSVVEYASEVVDQEPAGAVALIGELFHHPKTDQWAYTTQQAAIRKVLEAGLATDDAAVKADVEKVISYLASRGETSFLDLAAKG